MSKSHHSHSLNIADYFLHARVREGLGERTALIDDQGKWTYSEILERSAKCKDLLHYAGVRREERVLMVLSDGVDFVSVLFGVLGLGAVAVPVNPQVSPEILNVLIETTGATAVFIQQSDHDRFAQVLSLLNEPENLRTENLVPVQSFEVGCPAFESALAVAKVDLKTAHTHPDDSAVWLFSGGSTGQPKIVMQSHRSFIHTTISYAHGVVKYQPTDITLSVPKLHFGYALGSNLFFPFSVGATVILFSAKSTAATIFEKIRVHRPTLLITVPTLVARMLDIQDSSPQDLSCLRLATSAGEALPVPLHERWNARFNVELLDGLGTSEMWHIFISNRPGNIRLGTLGQIVPGFEVKLCNDAGEEVPTGEVGRMRVRGGARALGYWRQHEETQEAFLGQWYVSGDMLSRDQDGYYIYHGRCDDMFKLSGQFFSPAEVEACLLEHPDVKEAAVIGIRNDHGLQEPVACVVSEQNLYPQLVDFLKGRLATYKVPRRFKKMELLPRTHLGKVNRSALRELLEQEVQDAG